jgi:anti-anti-sigma factor
MSPAIVAVREAGRILVCVSGELDLAGHDLLVARCATIRPAPVELVLDLSGLTFVDCGSLRVLARLARAFPEHSGRVRVLAPEGPVSRVIDISGFFDGIPVTVAPSPAQPIGQAR